MSVDEHAWITAQESLRTALASASVHLIVGATALGKTARSVEKALETGAPVVVIDRFQVFEELRMGTGRPSPRELAGTRRIYLTNRRVVDGELSPTDAYLMLLDLLRVLLRDSGALILEGGSVSLLSRMVERRLLDDRALQIEYIGLPDERLHRQRIEQRVRQVLYPDDGRQSMLTELAAVMDIPSAFEFVSGITGYNGIVAHCRAKGLRPDELPLRPPDPDLVGAVVESHMVYARSQRDFFQRLGPSYPTARRLRLAAGPYR